MVALSLLEQSRRQGEGTKLVGAKRKDIAGIRQLPLNVFNAVVGARKRSERRGRSVGRSAWSPFSGGDRAVWADGATPASCFSFDFSLSLYVLGGIGIVGLG